MEKALKKGFLEGKKGKKSPPPPLDLAKQAGQQSGETRAESSQNQAQKSDGCNKGKK